MGALLSFGQDGRWRRFLVSKTNAVPGSRVLDVAAGTQLVSRSLAAGRACGLWPSTRASRCFGRGRAEPAAGLEQRVAPILGQAEHLPFEDGSFDAVTFTYLLRYVEDPAATLRELARVIRPGGSIATLEFHVPRSRTLVAAGGPTPGWSCRSSAPSCRRPGAIYRPGSWDRASARFLRHALRSPSRSGGGRRRGLRHVRTRVMSFGVGIVVWAVKDGPRVL